jgi:hypothetical protein
MSESRIDQVINQWTQRHRTMLVAVYKEDSSRCIDFADENNHRYQIWVDPPMTDLVHASEEFGVHVWDFKRKRRDFTARIGDLDKRIDEAFAQIKKWVSEDSRGN